MAKVAATVQSLDAVPEPMRELYAQGDNGAYVLQVEGTIPGTDSTREIKEFRERNIRLDQDARAAREALEKFQKQFDGIDPATAREALAQRQQLTDKELLKKGDVDTLINQRVQAALSPVTERLTAAEQRAAQAEKALEQKVVDAEIIAAARRAGELNPGAEDMLITKACAAGWGAVDGKLVQQANGAPVYSTSKPGQLRGIDEWITEDAVSQLGWMWKPSVGSGTSAGPRAPGEPGMIDPNNRAAFRANLEAIASGKKKVGALT